jgi:uncharacterized protein (DUF983 family)
MIRAKSRHWRFGGRPDTMMARTAKPLSMNDQRDRQNTPATLGTLWLRALMLRCPACGRAPIFRGWFTMNDSCPACGRKFNRGAGYFLGSIYFNYGVTATLVLVLYFAMFFGDVLTNGQRLAVLSLLAVLFPTWFFRYARALWIAFDEHWDPWPNEEESRQMSHAKEFANEKKKLQLE